MADVLKLHSEPTASDCFDHNRFVPSVLGEALKREAHISVGEGDRLYRYDGGVYRPDGEKLARCRAREILGDRFRRQHPDEVIAWLKAHPATIDTAPPKQRINVSNGLLDWRNRVLHPHTPEFRSALQIPVKWVPEAQCPLIDAFLAEVLPDGSCVDLVYEIAGYALYPENALHKAVMLLGPGRNGKSVLLSVLRALLGIRNVSAVPLQSLSESRFASAELFGKLANVCGDLDARAIRRTDAFKMLTGGDTIMAERKFCHPFEFISFALPIFSANEAPLSSDQSYAWFERWVVVPMTKVIPLESRDTRLTEKLTTTSELEGLLVQAVVGLRRVMERGRFAEPKSVKAAGADYRERLDTVAGFLADECLIGGPEAFAARGVLYPAYTLWCERQGHRFPLRASAVYQRLREHPEIQEGARHGGERGFCGLALRRRRP